MDVRDYFDRVTVINLQRRSDRWKRFCQSIGGIDWPFGQPQRVPAVDGDAVTVPIWWKQGGGAWGCLMSHARILEDCIRDGVERVLILEDDVVFVRDFSDRAKCFLENVPSGWDQIYFGGQHLRDPIPYNEHVYRCVNVNRTHCHAVSRPFMSRMYRYILDARDYLANPGHHIDHRLGALQESGTVKAYSPTQWLAGQGEDQSDISGRAAPTYFWNTWAGVPQMTMTVVLGLHEADGREVAGLMQQLGVHFGHRVGGYRPPYVEDTGLGAICESVFPFPDTGRRMTPDQTTPLLHDWCRLILQEAADYGTVGAACYPHLCAMYQDMAQAWSHLKVVDVECGLSRAVQGLCRRSTQERGWLRITQDQAQRVQTFLVAGKRQWLAHCEHMTVHVHRLKNDRRALIEQLKEFLKIRGVSNQPASAAV